MRGGCRRGSDPAARARADAVVLRCALTYLLFCAVTALDSKEQKRSKTEDRAFRQTLNKFLYLKN